MDETPPALPIDHAARLAGLLEQHGKRFQIAQDAGTGVWAAVERPSPTALHVVVAYTLAELAAKLDAQGREAGG